MEDIDKIDILKQQAADFIAGMNERDKWMEYFEGLVDFILESDWRDYEPEY